MRRTTDGTTRICCVGNSLTQGNNPGTPYTTQLDALLPAQYVVTNRSRGGWPTQNAPLSPDAFTNLQYIYLTDALPDISLTADRNILILWEARNHMGLGGTARQAADGIWTYTARARRSGWELWVCNVIDTNPIGFSDAARSECNGYLAAEWAANGASKHIDLASLLPNRNNSALFHDDFVHLKTAGYGVVAARIAQEFGY